MVRHYIVKGRVQGVGFRWLVHREAGVRGLKGWVRNTDGGEVEIMVAGSEEKLAELRAVLERGSRGSRVDAVYESNVEETMAEGLESFQIEGAWWRLMPHPPINCEPLKSLIRTVPNFPKPGILFYDITTLLKDKKGYATLVDALAAHYIGF